METNTNLYSSPRNPARNIVELAEYLLSNHQSHFLYRGQRKEYPGPLLPSAYRRKQLLGEVSLSNHECFRHSMRQLGRKFYKVHRFRNFDDIYIAYSGQKTIQDRTEVTLLRHMIYDSDLSKLISQKGFDNAIKQILPAEAVSRYDHRFEVWKSVLDSHHKGLLRLNAANQFLGFRIGQTLSQQYIENSEYLDVTRSPLIAAFFGTYSANNITRL